MTDLSPFDRLLEQMREDVIALQGDRVITHYADELEAALSTIRAEETERAEGESRTPETDGSVVSPPGTEKQADPSAPTWWRKLP